MRESVEISAAGGQRQCDGNGRRDRVAVCVYFAR